MLPSAEPGMKVRWIQKVFGFRITMIIREKATTESLDRLNRILKNYSERERERERENAVGGGEGRKAKRKESRNEGRKGRKFPCMDHAHYYYYYCSKKLVPILLPKDTSKYTQRWIHKKHPHVLSYNDHPRQNDHIQT